ncbi:hypothetical protein D1606_13390 [Rummeliibacillus sp. POC4]|nr:hypothetical protein D1606_13390 [Rummeliibacillus sp. POC4]
MIIVQKIILLSIGLYSLAMILLIVFKRDKIKLLTNKNADKIGRIMVFICVINLICTVINPSLWIFNLSIQILFIEIICIILFRIVVEKPNKLYFIILCFTFSLMLILQFFIPIILNAS